MLSKVRVLFYMLLFVLPFGGWGYGDIVSAPKVDIVSTPESGVVISSESGIVISHTEQGKIQRDRLKLASWNIRILSDHSRDDGELRKIAHVLLNYDFISIVELHDEAVLKRLQIILLQQGNRRYNYQISPPVGRLEKERVAFLYDVALVDVVRRGELYPDVKDNFSRDPYWATFRAGRFDFSIIAVHVIWGDSVARRQAEIQALLEVYAVVQFINGAENDVLLVGDFNRNSNDAIAYSALKALPTMEQLFLYPQKSHIRDTSLYDNIFFQRYFTKEYAGKCGINKFDETDFGNDDKAASLAVSDHRPVWAHFWIDGVDDDGSDDGKNRLEILKMRLKELQNPSIIPNKPTVPSDIR